MTRRAGPLGEGGWKRRSSTRWLAALALMAPASIAAAQQVAESAAGQPVSVTFTLGKMFTFLFLTLGPLKLLGPFAKATQGVDTGTKRRLALKSTGIALLGVLVASTLGENTLRKWNVSIGALLMTAGLILFLTALKPILEQFAGQEVQEKQAPVEGAPLISPMALAFPRIVTPYGVAILIVLMSLSETDTTSMQVLLVAIFVLLLDLLAMLFAEQILKTPLVGAALGIVGVVMGVLQVALGVQAMVAALRLLGFVRV